MEEIRKHECLSGVMSIHWRPGELCLHCRSWDYVYFHNKEKNVAYTGFKLRIYDSNWDRLQERSCSINHSFLLVWKCKNKVWKIFKFIVVKKYWHENVCFNMSNYKIQNNLSMEDNYRSLKQYKYHFFRTIQDLIKYWELASLEESRT